MFPASLSPTPELGVVVFRYKSRLPVRHWGSGEPTSGASNDGTHRFRYLRPHLTRPTLLH